MTSTAAPAARRARGLWIGLGVAFALVLAGIWYFRDDILSTALDPKVPFQTYQPPRPPNYAQRSDWALYPDAASIGAVDVFFVHPTSYDGGSQWVGPIPQPRTDPVLFRTLLPNYAGPFSRLGRVFAPRYRHASLYALLRPFRDDAREAQEFAYEDVHRAFRHYLQFENQGRPFILAGAEQGGLHAARLLRDEIASQPQLLSRLVGVYLMETAVPSDEYGPNAAVPACRSRRQSGCVVAWTAVVGVDLQRTARLQNDALTWRRRRLVRFDGRPFLCVNPVLGAQTEAMAPARLNLGAANATGLEWGVRPAFLVHQVSSHCLARGLLQVSAPRSSSLKRSGNWTDALRVAGHNLFYADIEADAQRRVAAWAANHRDAVAIQLPSAARLPANQTIPARPSTPSPSR